MDKLIGPALPPHLMNRVSLHTEDNETDSSELISDQFSSETNVYGPVLPPHFRKEKKPNESPPVVGPSIPPEMVHHNMNSLPSNNAIESEDSEDDVVGPPVPGSDSNSGTLSLSHQKLEMRAHYLKRKIAEEGSLGDKKRVTERESWMLELPPERAVNLGLGPRTFRKREGPDLKDRSDWTDTPADRLRKQQLGQEGCSAKVDKDEVMKAAASRQRDEVMERMAESSKDEKRQLSLLEMHQKELLKKQKKEKKKRGDKPPERRPFDRNIDLQANRFDEAQKKSIFKKAQLLDTRFSSGQSKYL